MHDVPVPTRRSFVCAALLGAVGAGTLAACSSDAPPPTSGTRAPATTAAGSVPASSPAAGGSSVAESSLAALSDVPVGGAITVEGTEGPVVIAQPTAGTVVGFNARCPHQGTPVRPSGDLLQCPNHGSTFEVATGKVLKGPAVSDLVPFAVKIDGDTIIPA